MSCTSLSFFMLIFWKVKKNLVCHLRVHLKMRSIFLNQSTLKCTEKRFIPFTPSISSLILSPIQNFKEALPMPHGHRMYSIIHLSKIIRLSASLFLYTKVSLVGLHLQDSRSLDPYGSDFAPSTNTDFYERSGSG